MVSISGTYFSSFVAFSSSVEKFIEFIYFYNFNERTISNF